MLVDGKRWLSPPEMLRLQSFPGGKPLKPGTGSDGRDDCGQCVQPKIDDFTEVPGIAVIDTAL